MPKIPEYQSHYPIPVAKIPRGKISTAGYVGESVAKVGEGIFDIGKAFKEVNRVTEYSNATVASLKALNELETKYEESPTPDPVAFKNQAMEVYNDISSNLKDSKVKSLFHVNFNKNLAVKEKNIIHLKRRRDGEHSIAGLYQELKDLRGLAAQAKSPADHDKIVATGKAAIAGRAATLIISEAVGVKEENKFLQGILTDSARRDILYDPEQAITKLEDPKEYAGLDEGVRITLLDRAIQRVERKKGFEKARVKTLIADDLMSRSTTGQGDPDLLGLVKDVIGEDAAKVLELKQVFSEDKFRYVELLKRSSMEEGVKVLEGIKPEPGKEDYKEHYQFYAGVSAKFQQLQSALRDDPAGYIGAYFPEEGGDIDTNLAMQESLGLQSYERRVTTKTQSMDMVAKIQSMPASSQAQVIEGLRSEYGRHFDQVYSELVQDGLPAATQVVATVADNPLILRRVSEAVATGRNKLKETIGDTAIVNQTVESVRDALSDYRETVMRAGWDSATIETFNKLQNVIMDTALLRVSKGVDPGSAASEAVDQVILRRYHPLGGWFTGKLKYARIPTGLDRDTIRELASDKIDNIHLYDLDLPNENWAGHLRMIKRESYWATLPNDQGLVLMYNGIPVMTTDGGTIEFDFPGQRYEVLR